MKTMAAGEFKARCLQVMDQVSTTRTPVVITKRGKPIAKLVPADQAQDWVPGRLAGKIEILDPNWAKPMSDEEVDAFVEGR